MIVITAPDYEKIPQDCISIFLAGGIQKCDDWQLEIIEKFNTTHIPEGVCLLNPRRENFPIHDPNASEEQITWEYNMLMNCDMFTMCFLDSESDQPICFYELGRYIEIIKQRFPLSWQYRIVVSCDSKFRRVQDVIIQTKLATGDRVKVNVCETSELITTHFNSILKNIKEGGEN